MRTRLVLRMASVLELGFDLALQEANAPPFSFLELRAATALQVEGPPQPWPELARRPSSGLAAVETPRRRNSIVRSSEYFLE